MEFSIGNSILRWGFSCHVIWRGSPFDILTNTRESFNHFLFQKYYFLGAQGSWPLRIINKKWQFITKYPWWKTIIIMINLALSWSVPCWKIRLCLMPTRLSCNSRKTLGWKSLGGKHFDLIWLWQWQLASPLCAILYCLWERKIKWLPAECNSNWQKWAMSSIWQGKRKMSLASVWMARWSTWLLIAEVPSRASCLHLIMSSECLMFQRITMTRQSLLSLMVRWLPLCSMIAPRWHSTLEVPLLFLAISTRMASERWNCKVRGILKWSMTNSTRLWWMESNWM